MSDRYYAVMNAKGPIPKKYLIKGARGMVAHRLRAYTTDEARAEIEAAQALAHVPTHVNDDPDPDSMTLWIEHNAYAWLSASELAADQHRNDLHLSFNEATKRAMKYGARPTGIVVHGWEIWAYDFMDHPKNKASARRAQAKLKREETKAAKDARASL